MLAHKEVELAGNGGNAQLWLQVVLVSALAAPGPILRTLEIAGLPHPDFPHIVESLIFGFAIFAAATLLVWASEVAEQMISATLALAVLAIIAVLPEYAVDLYFAWTAHATPEHAQFALANMTGANRLLIGMGWPVVFFLFYLRQRQRPRIRDLSVSEQNAVGLIFLGIATLYSLTIPLRGHLSLLDSAVMISLFVAYLILSSRTPPLEEQPLVGPAKAIAALPKRLRWTVVVGLFAYAAGVVFASAEPFANGLIHTGETLNVNKFVLVQWVAPLASESPEFLLAAMLALRGRASAGMTLLISSKVNQWTLLVGSLPLAYSISGTTLSPLHMDARQVDEVFLTAGQSLFAVAVLASLSFSFSEALLIFALFAVQLVIPYPSVRLGFGGFYILIASLWFLNEWRVIPVLFQKARRSLAPVPLDDPGGT
ncbi:MAG: hypothetical protein WBD55_02255 [Dehalococcoidia bacterium]